MTPHRSFLESMPLVIALASLLATSLLTKAETPQNPNVLFIAVDDLKPALGSFGDSVALSPHIDKLAGEGTAFLNNHCQQAICGPSRASLLTGLRPDTTKVFDLKTRMRDVTPDILTIPQHFRQNGYETVGMGKIFDPRCVDCRKHADKPSWSTPYLHVYPRLRKGGRMGYLNPKAVAWIESQTMPGSGYSKGAKLPGRPATEGSEDVPDEAYRDGAIANEAVSWIKKLGASDKPFFLAVGFFKPHLPFVAPKKYWDLYKREDFKLASFQDAPEGAPSFALQPSWELRSGYDVPSKGAVSEDKQRELIHGYYACVSYVDAQIGKLLAALEESGQRDNTIVVLWGDHGFHLGDHAMWCKHTNFEQATRSPLIISAPNQKRSGGRVASPTEFTDIFPTLCQLAKLPTPQQLEGVSLQPLLDDPSAAVRNVALSQYPRRDKGKHLMGYSYRDDRYRYTIWKEMNVYKGDTDGPVYGRELYDYEAAPLETKNLVDDPEYAAVVQMMEEKRMSLDSKSAAKN